MKVRNSYIRFVWPWEREKLMNDELLGLLDELLEYFELDSEEWPMVSVYSGGEYISGVIDDDLYRILVNIKEVKDDL